MVVIYNKVIPFKGFSAINLFGVVFARTEANPLSDRTLNHEAIHAAQMRELLYVFFYLIYFVEWVVRLAMKGNAYRQISFEREAYENQNDRLYLLSRKPYSQWRK